MGRHILCCNQMTQNAVYRRTTPDHGIRRWKALAFGLLLFCSLPGQSQQVKFVATALPDAPNPQAAESGPNQDQSSGTISGTVVDQNGNFVLAARVRLLHEGQSEEKEVSSDKDGRFIFSGVAPGPFQLTVSAEGFAIQQQLGVLGVGEVLTVPQISLPIAATTTEVQVRVSNFDLAEEQIKVQETQRVLGVIPNFYVTYRHDSPPLAPRQKFELAWKSAVDPVTFAASGVVAGIEQANDGFSGYGQGAQGYAKRYGSSYADGFIGNMIGGFLLPSLFRQDPRYFYKGNGSTRARIFYALANAVICKGDNGHWQADYSGILGSLAAGGLSNLYYPASSRNGARLTFENTAIGIGGSGVSNLLQEFLIRRLTPHTHGQTNQP
jgi:Carboxypeptidase regulatory-like domain